MNKKLFKLFSVTLATTTALSLSGCSETAKGKTLAKAASPTELSYAERTSEEFLSFSEKCNGFSSSLATQIFSDYKKADNFAVSPVSVFMALAMAAECSDGNTREEILDSLGVTRNELLTNVKTLHRALNETHTVPIDVDTEKTVGRLDFDNSIWLDNGVNAYLPTLNTLATEYYCSSFEVDFDGKNAEANEAIQNYVKEKTRGLINQNFNLSDRTVFALVNALYLKDVWNTDGEDLKRTEQAFDFRSSDGDVTSKRFLKGRYNEGQIYETENYSTFFTKTDNGYTIKFVLPAEGIDVREAFTKATLDEVTAKTGWDEETETDGVKTVYYTRCIFPEFEVSYLDDVRKYLMELGIQDLFSPDACDFSAITDMPAYCAQVTHAAKLKVNRKGIEGAAVTVLGGSATAGPPTEVTVYRDFVVDRSFGFVLTDRYGLTLFSGVVDKI